MIPLAPTLPVAFHAEKFSYKTFTFIAFSLGEQDGFGNPWEDFYKDCHGEQITMHRERRKIHGYLKIKCLNFS